jgi:hypothetical protein
VSEDELEPMQRIEPIEMIIDSRLQSFYKRMNGYFDDGDEEEIRKFVASLLRAAYGRGLVDGANNSIETKKLFKLYGFRLK